MLLRGYVPSQGVFTDLTTTFNYEPLRLGSATFSLGIGNPSYSSLFVDQIRDKLKNQGISFDDISLNYYKDYYFKLFNTFEATNGLLLQTGVDYHIRRSKNNVTMLRSLTLDGDPSVNSSAQSAPLPPL